MATPPAGQRDRNRRSIVEDDAPVKITFLGTAAAEGYPDPFCRCDNCEGARRIGGRALRKRASVLLDDELLIDFGPDLLPASQIHNVPLADIRYAVQTHGHDDHLFPDNFIYRTDRCHVKGGHHIEYAVSPYVARKIKDYLVPHFRSGDDLGNNHFPSFRMDLVIQQQWETVDLGPYRLIAIPAVHAPGTEARILGIRKRSGLVRNTGTSVLYATDTAPMPDGTWERVAAEGWSFELVVMDCTHGTEQHSAVHHSIGSMLDERERMRGAGVVAEDARFIAHHFTHHSTPLPDELDRLAMKDGFEVAYDGMSVEV
jgi:phosphoribosyl 1,2-cyclic phosphate phosphodiesterase